jgi:uncharacterized damage-inducible protein DinB
MSERDDFLSTLRKHRGFLLQTTDGVSEEQARTRSTVSELTLASILKHVADVEEGWVDFGLGVEGALGGDFDPAAFGSGDYVDTRFQLQDDDTLDSLRARYTDVAAHTDSLLASVDLDASRPLPKAPWFEPGASWTWRRVLLHIVAETAQHAGHADIIREAIDGAKTMG